MPDPDAIPRSDSASAGPGLRAGAAGADQRGQVAFVIGLLAAGAALLGKAVRDLRLSEREDRSART